MMAVYICKDCNNWVDLDIADTSTKAIELTLCQRCYEKDENFECSMSPDCPCDDCQNETEKSGKMD